MTENLGDQTSKQSLSENQGTCIQEIAQIQSSNKVAASRNPRARSIRVNAAVIARIAPVVRHHAFSFSSFLFSGLTLRPSTLSRATPAGNIIWMAGIRAAKIYEQDSLT